MRHRRLLAGLGCCLNGGSFGIFGFARLWQVRGLPWPRSARLDTVGQRLSSAMALTRKQGCLLGSRNRPLAKCLLVMVSRVTTSKRIGHGIEVVRWLVQTGVDAELDIDGSGSAHEVDRLRRLAVELNCSRRIRFHGWFGSDAKANVVANSFVIISTLVKNG